MVDNVNGEELAASVDLLMTMVEGIMQAQEYVVMSLLQEGSLDREGLKSRLETALAKEDVLIGTRFPLSRLLDILQDQPPRPPRWSPRVIEGRLDADRTPE
ncbi:hypothetical protein [Stutzerimonas kirkiae]|uniref:hypothetical protein n=1 Tax=Stutzerimonas kirkiae TaxID=2211392 RepID=UPI00103857A5|nr:hypothetical protein [Stutzerimonas kirkiae]TBV10239.1 hypothetical protein DNK08_07110 [Stutzerimonas kirkiae]